MTAIATKIFANLSPESAASAILLNKNMGIIRIANFDLNYTILLTFLQRNPSSDFKNKYMDASIIEANPARKPRV